MLKKYPNLFEISRNFQRKYVSKFNLDEFKLVENIKQNKPQQEYIIKAKGISWFDKVPLVAGRAARKEKNELKTLYKDFNKTKQNLF